MDLPNNLTRGPRTGKEHGGFEVVILSGSEHLPGGRYASGHALQGWVSCVNNATVAHTLEEVTVEFGGEVRKKISTAHHVSEDNDHLFHLKHQLFVGERKLYPGQSLEFSFQLTIPKNTLPLGQGRDASGFPSGGDDASYLLPPSYALRDLLWPSSSLHYETGYSLKATVRGEGMPSPISTGKRICIIPAAETELPGPKAVILPLLPRSTQESHVYSKTISLFRTTLPGFSSKPNYKLQVQLVLSNDLAWLQESPVAVSAILSDSEGPTNPETTTLIIKDMEFSLVACDEFNLRGIQGQRKREVHTWKFHYADGKAIPPNGDRSLLEEKLVLPPASPQMVPDFDMPSLSHRHLLQVRFKIQHLESSCVFRFANQHSFIIQRPYVLQDAKRPRESSESGELDAIEMQSAKDPERSELAADEAQPGIPIELDSNGFESSDVKVLELPGDVPHIELSQKGWPVQGTDQTGGRDSKDQPTESTDAESFLAKTLSLVNFGPSIMNGENRPGNENGPIKGSETSEKFKQISDSTPSSM